jgi:hypothetical protein
MSILQSLRSLLSWNRQKAGVVAVCCVTAIGTVEHKAADGTVLNRETVRNLITNAGRVFLHTQGYATSGAAATGFCYIGLSNDTLTETAASTVLSNEIAANGLSRAIGTVTLATGSGTSTTIAKTFTCATGAQSAQKAALFTASSAGTMNHVLAFTQRALQIGDTLTITFTITTS